MRGLEPHPLGLREGVVVVWGIGLQPRHPSVCGSLVIDPLLAAFSVMSYPRIGVASHMCRARIIIFPFDVEFSPRHCVYSTRAHLVAAWTISRRCATSLPHATGHIR